ncbi:hypothetical protein IWZ01DRAFT_490470 [Phyllosticta capitalensis]
MPGFPSFFPKVVFSKKTSTPFLIMSLLIVGGQKGVPATLSLTAPLLVLAGPLARPVLLLLVWVRRISASRRRFSFSRALLRGLYCSFLSGLAAHLVVGIPFFRACC